MAIWKKLNPETGEYEPIENSDSGNGGIAAMDTVGIADAYTTYPMSEVADSTGSNYWATIYKISGLMQGDTVNTKRGHNGQGGIIGGDGKDLTGNIVWTDFVYGTLVLDQDYEQLTVYVNKGDEAIATVSRRTADMMTRPGYKGEFVPTISDAERSTLKTLSSDKIRADYGMDVLKARAALEGGVWVALGDSYTVYADPYFRSLAEKYGMIYDGQGKVSSTVCGDDTGSKGFAPFHSRMDAFIANYTGVGQTINGVAYTAEDVKLITFMGGANDGFGKSSWLGDSPTSMNTGYIYGACNYMFRRLQESFPNARVICILQPANYFDAMNYTDDATAQTLGFANLAELQKWDVYAFGQYKMECKEKVVMECAKRFGIHIVDCIFDWYSVVNPTQRARYWDPDKIHLSAAGSKALAEKLDREGILELFGK
jgi:lysophospholipase L1-like esterase